MIPNPLRCDIFCSVIDNFGDAAVSWRLARQLATEHSWHIRLWIDDLGVLQKLVPTLAEEPVEVCGWARSAAFDIDRLPDVVIEAFACYLPEDYVTAMAAAERAPVWLNLEYLTAESWIDDCHGMASKHPQHGLSKYFFFPGFPDKSGGLLREADYDQRRECFDEAAFRREFQLPPRGPGELSVSMFSYPNPAMAALLEAWRQHPLPVHLLWPGYQETVEQRGHLHIHPLPFLPQSRYDELLWACDLNFVRGEDSFVRAQWAGKPFVWHIYPQADDAHRVKLDAFLNRITAKVGADETTKQQGGRAKDALLAVANGETALCNFWHAWNGRSEIHWPDFYASFPYQTEMFAHWGKTAATKPDLAAKLVNFCSQRLK